MTENISVINILLVLNPNHSSYWEESEKAVQYTALAAENLNFISSSIMAKVYVISFSSIVCLVSLQTIWLHLGSHTMVY